MRYLVCLVANEIDVDVAPLELQPGLAVPRVGVAKRDPAKG
jgi:hypothetical protein